MNNENVYQNFLKTNMNNENIYQNFLNANANNKLSFFNMLDEKQKSNLFNWLNATYPNMLNDLVNSMSPINIQSVAEQFDEQTRMEFYKHLTKDQLRGYYNILGNKKEKHKLLNVLDDLRNELAIENDNIKDNINSLNNKIVNSTEFIANKKEDIIEQNQELKKVKKKIKKLEKERSKALKQALKNYQPSPLDKIGFISKHKKNKLQEKITRYKELEKEINYKKEEKSVIEENIQDLKKEIRKEKTNIKKYEYESKKKNIAIGNNLIAIKNISSLEKNALGMQLYNRLCNRNDLVMERPNNRVKNTTHKVTEIKHIEEKKVEPPKEVKQETVKATNTQQPQNKQEISNETVKQFERIKTSMDFLHQIGIKFVMENVNIPPQNNTNLLNNPIAKKDTNTIISITEIIKRYGNYLNSLDANNIIIPEQTNAVVRTRTKGYVDFALVVAFTLTVIITSLFLGALLVK